MSVFEELRRISLFGGLSDEDLRRVVVEGSEKFVAAGGVNGREGDPVEHLYVILEGELRITKQSDGAEMVINTYTTGSFFAEVPLLAGTPFLATGRTLTDCRLFLIPNELFRRMLTEHPSFSDMILETMAERVQILQSIAGQREKLNSLGTLAAGLAHELNNPAAATRRSAADLRVCSADLRALGWRLANAAARGDLDSSSLDALERVVHETLARVASAPATTLDALEGSEREEEISLWLEDHGLDDCWELAPTFTEAGLDTESLEAVAEAAPPDLRPDALRYLEAALEVAGLLDEVEGSAARVSEIVGAMEGYSYMDRAPVQEVDVNRSLEDTLSVLNHRLDGIEVHRDFDPDLPRVTAYGGELNQVWTSLLDNAVDAVSGDEGARRIRVRTGCEGDRVLVEVSDNGPGIPEDLRSRIFEPFFTTKEVGAGTGLGLDVSYRVVVGRHGGDIRLISEPGDTRFEVRLPAQGPGDEASVAGRDLRMEAGR